MHTMTGTKVESTTADKVSTADNSLLGRLRDSSIHHRKTWVEVDRLVGTMDDTGIMETNTLSTELGTNRLKTHITSRMHQVTTRETSGIYKEVIIGIKLLFRDTKEQHMNNKGSGKITTSRTTSHTNSRAMVVNSYRNLALHRRGLSAPDRNRTHKMLARIKAEAKLQHQTSKAQQGLPPKSTWLRRQGRKVCDHFLDVRAPTDDFPQKRRGSSKSQSHRKHYHGTILSQYFRACRRRSNPQREIPHDHRLLQVIVEATSPHDRSMDS